MCVNSWGISSCISLLIINTWVHLFTGQAKRCDLIVFITIIGSPDPSLDISTNEVNVSNYGWGNRIIDQLLILLSGLINLTLFGTDSCTLYFFVDKMLFWEKIVSLSNMTQHKLAKNKKEKSFSWFSYV